MSLFYLPFLSSRDQLVEELARSVAQSCQGKIRAQIGDRALGMTAAEAKGYARAMVGDLLRDEVRRLVERYALDSHLAPAVAGPAIEQALDRAASRLVAKRRPSAMRRAA